MRAKMYICPICKKKNFENIFARGVYSDKINISICKNCGLVCQNPRMNEAFFNNYYNSNEYYGCYQPKINVRENLTIHNTSRAGQIFRQTAGYIKKSSSVLEIGSGLGDNLIFFHKKGYQNLQGVEINRSEE